MKAKFSVQGKPQGKGRARVTNRCGYTHAYTPQSTLEYENLIKMECKRQCGNIYFSAGVPLKLSVIAIMPIPKATSKAKQAEMFYAPVKPDADNILKVICDALNGVVYADDNQIVDMHITKMYGENPYISVTVTDAWNNNF